MIAAVAVATGFFAFLLTVGVLLSVFHYSLGPVSGVVYAAVFGLGVFVAPVAALSARALLLSMFRQPLDDDEFFGHSVSAKGFERAFK